MENQRLRCTILEIYLKAKKRLGADKIRIILRRDYGISISTGRVYRLMKNMQLPKMSTVKPRLTLAKTENTLSFNNHLKQQFNPDQPNQAWVSDITYVKTGTRFSYICVILDLFSRKVVSFRVSNKMSTAFVIDTLKDALRKRGITGGLLFHSDRGSQFTSYQFRAFLDSAGITQSFSKPGHPWDNAVVECFFKYLKHEELNRYSFKDIDALKLAAFQYIEGFYNEFRPHSANNMLSPNQMESLFFYSHP